MRNQTKHDVAEKCGRLGGKQIWYDGEKGDASYPVETEHGVAEATKCEKCYIAQGSKMTLRKQQNNKQIVCNQV